MFVYPSMTYAPLAFGVATVTLTAWAGGAVASPKTLMKAAAAAASIDFLMVCGTPEPLCVVTLGHRCISHAYAWCSASIRRCSPSRVERADQPICVQLKLFNMNITPQERLQQCRSKLKLSQDTFARKINASKASVSNWERPGGPIPRLEMRHAIDEYFVANLPNDYQPGELPRLWLNTESQMSEAQDSSVGEPAFPEPTLPDDTRPVSTYRTRRLMIGSTIVAAVGLMIGSWVLLSNNDREPLQPGRAEQPDPNRYGTGKIITIDNRVVLSETSMREDEPAYFSTRPELFCERKGCEVANTGLATGDKARALCQTIGDKVTNRFGDTPNPNNVDSTLWYLVRDAGGYTGYLSEVWVVKSQRGGLNLQTCANDSDLISPAIPTTSPPSTTTITTRTWSVASESPVTVMTEPSPEGKQLLSLPTGTPITIECSIVGQPVGIGKYPDNATWNRITIGDRTGYIADVFTNTDGNGDKRVLPSGGYYLPTIGIPECPSGAS
jgi:DNA-binding XRE family transcriptional regulator